MEGRLQEGVGVVIVRFESAGEGGEDWMYRHTSVLCCFIWDSEEGGVDHAIQDLDFGAWRRQRRFSYDALRVF